jgi:hypothetical protein
MEIVISPHCPHCGCDDTYRPEGTDFGNYKCCECGGEFQTDES